MAKRTKHIIPAQQMQMLPDETISHILETDYKSYARYVVQQRAIPHFADGLKIVQRKALACAFKYAAKDFISVSSISGSMKGFFKYHHGESSANGAIVVMNQQFMMAMPYLDSSESQYGWLYEPVAGEPRYIETRLTKWSKILMGMDESDLDWVVEDGIKCEPKHYLPILPMTLINGTNGIAVGYATTFRNYNPLEIYKCVIEYLKTGKLRDYNLTPYKHGHQGVWSYWNGEFEHCGTYERIDKNILSITGLPISTTIPKYEAFLNSLVDSNQILRWRNLTEKQNIRFDLEIQPDFLTQLENDHQIANFFQLIYRLPKDNLTVVMPTGETRRFNTPTEYVKAFVDYRLPYYTRRKRRRIDELTKEIKFLNDLIRFIYMVINYELDFRGKTRKQLEQELIQIDITPDVLNINVYQLTADNIAKHNASIEKLRGELDWFVNTHEREMYLHDLKALKADIEHDYNIEFVLNLKSEKLVRIA